MDETTDMMESSVMILLGILKMIEEVKYSAVIGFGESYLLELGSSVSLPCHERANS